MFFCVSNCCLAERCFFSGFGWASERSRFFMTLFFGILQLGLFEFYFSSFGLVLSGIGIIVCVLRLVFALKLWSFVAVMHACRRWR